MISKRMNNKYFPLKIALYYAVVGLVVSLVLSVINYFLKGTPILTTLEIPAFLAFFVLFMGVLYCEITYILKNKIVASLLFGFIGSQSFLLFAVGSLWVTKGIIRDVPIEWYLTFSLSFGALLSVIYYGFTQKQGF